jgi:hypothetical protein
MNKRSGRRRAVRLAAKSVIVTHRRALEPAEIYDRIPKPVREELKIERRHFYRQLSPGDGLVPRSDGRWTVDVGELWDHDAQTDRKSDVGRAPDWTSLL